MAQRGELTPESLDRCRYAIHPREVHVRDHQDFHRMFHGNRNAARICVNCYSATTGLSLDLNRKGRQWKVKTSKWCHGCFLQGRCDVVPLNCSPLRAFLCGKGSALEGYAS